MKNLVVKNNKLNGVTFFDSSVQLKIFSKIIVEIRKNQELESYKFAVNDLIKDFNYSKENYAWLKKTCKAMIRTLEFEKKEGFCLIVLFTKIETKEKGYITFTVNNELKPFILEQTASFTSYFLSNIAGLKSAYSLRIYELLKQYQDTDTKRGWYKVTLQDIKSRLNIADDKYQQYKHFKEKVLKVAQNELIAKTDIHFELQEIKQGRKVETLHFKIKPNNEIVKNEVEQTQESNQKIIEKAKKIKKKKVVKKEHLETAETKAQKELRQKDIFIFLKEKLALTDSFIFEIFEKYEKEKIERNLKYTVEQIKKDNVDNIGGFLRRALEQDYANDTKKTKGIFHIAKNAVMERFSKQFKK